VPVFADCTVRGTHDELKKRYNLKYYPTLLFLDEDGKQIASMGDSRDAASLSAKIEAVATGKIVAPTQPIVATGGESAPAGKSYAMYFIAATIVLLILNIILKRMGII
jgi:hypothetical protein